VIERPLIGEPLALDLVNTTWPERGQTVDYLAEPAGLRSWLAEHEDELGPGVAGDQAVLEPLRYARHAIRQALEQQEYGALNSVLGHGRLRLRMDGGTPLQDVDVDDEAWRPAWEASREFLDLVRTAPPGRIRNCDGSGCVLWFLDTTRNGSRRWCSMSGCGNRAKARAHYNRQKAG
jgi:predicted RNA-binding Zn ribbon-like protein